MTLLRWTIHDLEGNAHNKRGAIGDLIDDIVRLQLAPNKARLEIHFPQEDKHART